AIVLGLVALGVLATPATAQAPLTRLTRDEAVAAAVASNPTLRAKTVEVASVRANEITAGLIPNPQASYTATQLGSRNQDQQHTVSVGQTIETGGKRRRRLPGRGRRACRERRRPRLPRRARGPRAPAPACAGGPSRPARGGRRLRQGPGRREPGARQRVVGRDAPGPVRADRARQHVRL